MSENGEPTVIRDLIYLDEPKVTSILSQFEDGIVSEVESSKGQGVDRSVAGGAKAFGIGADVNRQWTETETRIERKKRHHEIVSILERELFRRKLAVDLNSEFNALGDYGLAEEGLTNRLAEYGYLKATGHADIHDYQKLTTFLGNFNQLIEDINRTVLHSQPANSQIGVKLRDLENQKLVASQEPDRNKRQKATQAVRHAESLINELKQEYLDNGKLDEEFRQSLSRVIRSLYSDRLVVYVHPQETNPALHVVAELKRDCFIDLDSDTFSRLYGSRPLVRLSILGLVTAIPRKQEKSISFMDRYSGSYEDPQAEIMRPLQIALQNTFESLNGIERSLNVSEFPAVTCFPIVVYREIKPAAI